MTSTKSPEHLLSMFNKVVQYKQIKSDSTKIASDNPHQDQAFIKKGLGDHFKALTDVFHVIQDIAKLVKIQC